ncbi:MAG: hypothetical protein HY392_01960 [Candidatus Diapherotrites archaeon]|nr:hypothetical protein [Candidatus Diapherotrites archaeon]
MDTKKILFLILLLGLTLRLGPVFLQGFPLSYDPWFHVRSTEAIIETGEIPLFEDAEHTKPNNYPPFYHIWLAGAHYLTGIEVWVLAAVMLPLVSSLVILSAFVFARRVFGEQKALIVAFFCAVFTPLLVASFDSPENFMLFLLPVVLFLSFTNHEKLAGALYASGFFWNYFFMLVTLPAFLFAFRGKKNALRTFFFSTLAFLFLNLASRGVIFFQNRSLQTGMLFVWKNLEWAFLAVFALTTVFFLWIFFSATEKKGMPEKTMLFCFGFFSLALMASFPFTVLARPWEQLKFVGLAGALLLAFVPFSENGKKMLVFLAAFMVVSSAVVSTHTLFPAVDKNDAQAIRALEELELEHEGRVIAQPSMAEYARAVSPTGRLFVTSLFFENSMENGVLEQSLGYLSQKKLENEDFFLRENGIRYVLLNFEDEATRGTLEFGEKEFFNQVYSLSYNNYCPLGFLGKKIGYDCGLNAAKILEFNEN